MPPQVQIIKKKRFLIAGFALATVIMFLMWKWLREEKYTGIVHPAGGEFAGPESCGSCHDSLYDNHLRTAHYLTSRPATRQSVKGSFNTGRNTFVMSDRLKVVMEQTSNGLMQSAFVDGMELNSRPMDLAIGSGRKGQTYLYWQGDRLFELPVSYYSALDQWCNSPGYPFDRILFNRPIPGRCIECHGTYMKLSPSDGGESFDRSKVILGVTCERCHGPGARHVSFHKDHPGEKTGRNIVNPLRLSRQQRLDNCALCHSGIRENIRPVFSFLAGDTLENYSLPNYDANRAGDLDVHGNQYGLLTASKCFRSSAMDCSSCHNVHEAEANNFELFSMRCMTCHPAEGHNFCSVAGVSLERLKSNCIECHMPALPSSQVLFRLKENQEPAPDLVRTHLVGIYPEQVKSYIAKINAMIAK